ncbi:MAG: KpsF/GutQ family sugar-phosphate isomerase [Bdellovibrionales bacterium]
MAKSDEDIIASARHVLTEEGKALERLASLLGPDFAKAVRLLVACEGRAIVSGMGKSGHIARKIAATMASTGTPAHFVHPGEASHGDLGMITPQDVVLALSNSGETAELRDLIAYTRRFSIPLISMTRNATSTLAKAADAALVTPYESEVCPMGLAPTTSTTMMLALGDALAVAVLECKGFTADDFHNFHPGGKLGKLLARVGELMHKGDELPLAPETASMADVLVVMTAKSFGCAGIVDDQGNLTGIITDGDLRRNLKHADLLKEPASSIMTKAPLTVAPTILAAEALKILNEHKRTQLFVVENGNPVGLLHIHDLLRVGIA